MPRSRARPKFKSRAEPETQPKAGQEAAAGVGAGGEDVAVWLEGGHGGGGGRQARVAPRQNVPHPLQTLQLLHPLHGGYRGAASAQGAVSHLTTLA